MVSMFEISQVSDSSKHRCADGISDSRRAKDWISENMDLEENKSELKALLVDIETTIRKSLSVTATPSGNSCHFDELHKLTKAERDSWLAEQCVTFENAVQQFFNDANFVEDLHKKLRKATRRWASWNHKKFGIVTSKEQVHELLLWEANNHPRLAFSAKEGSAWTSEPVELNPLERFESYCKASDNLLKTFLQRIYRPLSDFFVYDSDGDSLSQEIPRKLERLVQKWDALLQFSPINEKLFSKRSEAALHAVLSRGIYASYEFDNVLRLVPDLLEKKTQALRLAHKWRLLAKSHVERRGTFVVESNVKRLPLREQQISTRLPHSGDPTPAVNPTKDCDLYKADFPSRVCSTGINPALNFELPKVAHGHLPPLYVEHTSEMPASKISSPHEKALQQELDSCKMRYCTQKIKFLNARKQILNLSAQLDLRQQHCERLSSDLEAASRGNKLLTTQLETAKKHVQSQVTIVEALQHQCYTLKHDLDKSNIKKTELYENLSETLLRCKSLEEELLHARSEFPAIAKCPPENDGRLRNNQSRSSNNVLPPLQGIAKPSSSPMITRKDLLLPEISSARSF